MISCYVKDEKTFLYTLWSFAEILGSTIAQNQTPGILENAMDSIATSGQLQFQPLTKTKCERNGDPTAYEDSKFENSASVFLKCVHTLVNLTEFEAEMADARPENKQDAVIDKYCLRVSTFQQCMKNITDFISPCLEPQERTSVDILFGVTKSLLKFACNDGKKQIEGLISKHSNHMTLHGWEILTSFPVPESPQKYFREFDRIH